MDVREAAKRLEVSVTLIYELCHAGKLPHARIGLGRGTIRIAESDVEAYLRSARVEGPEEGQEGVKVRRRATVLVPTGGPSPIRLAEELAKRAGKGRA